MSKHKVRRKPQRPFPVTPMAIGLFLIGFAFVAMTLPRGERSAGSSSSVVPVSVNYPAPELSLQTIEDQTESLQDYRDQIVLVNNWATWCPPCKAEMPTLAAYYQEHKSDGFAIIAIEAGDSPESVLPFVQNYALEFPVWLDPKGASIRAFGNGTLPNSYVIDRLGTIRYAWTGEISKAMLEKYVTPLINENN
jgi:cytochrome c biogenesis protein CcmG/thiol:disulfide interchange protein DsbE